MFVSKLELLVLIQSFDWLADTSSKCNMDQLVGQLVRLLAMHRLCLRSEWLLALVMGASRFALFLIVCSNFFFCLQCRQARTLRTTSKIVNWFFLTYFDIYHSANENLESILSWKILTKFQNGIVCQCFKCHIWMAISDLNLYINSFQHTRTAKISPRTLIHKILMCFYCLTGHCTRCVNND